MPVLSRSRSSPEGAFRVRSNAHRVPPAYLTRTAPGGGWNLHGGSKVQRRAWKIVPAVLRAAGGGRRGLGVKSALRRHRSPQARKAPPLTLHMQAQLRPPTVSSAPASPRAIPDVAAHPEARAEAPAGPDRADRLGEHRLARGAGGAGLGADQQVRRGLSGQALLRRLRGGRRGRDAWPSSGPSSCSAASSPTSSRTPAARPTRRCSWPR